MKVFALFIAFLVSAWSFGQASGDDIMDLAESIEWHGQASIKIPFKGKTVYVDPFKLPKNDTPDLVFITHSHGDHFNVNELAKLNSDNVMIVAPVSMADKLKENGFTNLVLVKPGDRFGLDGVNIEVFPAYNVVKTNFHPKENNWVGYVIGFDGLTVYHPGDTERIPEMKNINCDIAFMPLGQTYTMNSVEEAANAIKDIDPAVAIPFHYGLYEGAVKDAEIFREKLAGSYKVLVKALNDR